MLKSLFLFFFCLNLIATAQVNTSIFTIHNGDQFETPFVNKQGKVIFNLPPGHVPITEPPITSSIIIWSENKKIEAFSDGICPVVRPDKSIYWVNEKGETLRDFGTQYSKIEPFSEGYCRAWERIGSTDSYWLIYLDKKGNNAFGRKFWEAKQFSEGLAVVQPEKNGAWGYINKNGVFSFALDKSIIGNTFALESFKNELAVVTTTENKSGKEIHHHYFIDKRGRMVLDLGRIIPAEYSIVQVLDFNDGIAGVYVAKEGESEKLLLIEKSGKTIHTFSHTRSFIPCVNGLLGLVFEYPGDKNSVREGYKLMLKNGTAVFPDSSKVRGTILTPQFINNSFYQFFGMGKSDFTVVVFERKNNKLVFEKEGKLISMVDDVLLLKHEKTDEFELIKLPNTLLWKTPVGNKTFLSIEEALVYKDKVRSIKLSSKSTLSPSILECKNLENLTISYSDLDVLPDYITQIKSLKRLDLLDLKKLERLPSGISQMPNLQILYISDCPELSGFEDLVSEMKSLKQLVLTNVKLDEGFEARMKEINPSLKIDRISSSMFFLDELEESE